MQRSLAIGALALLLVSPAVFGQAQKGSISVTVADADGQRLPGATVTAVSSETLTRRTVITDATGEAMIVALDPAINYVVTVSLDGFSSSTVNEVVVRAGQAGSSWSSAWPSPWR